MMYPPGTEQGKQPDDNVDTEADIAADTGTTDELGDEVSKSQLKRDALQVRKLGAELAALGESERARIPLEDDVLSAIEELNRIRPGANGARKRQLGFLGKRLRHANLESIEQALETIRQSARAATADLHLAESWRDRLLGDGPAELPAEALTAFLDEHRASDRQALRQLQQRALAERKAGKPPAAARKLFKQVRDTLALGRDPG